MSAQASVGPFSKHLLRPAEYRQDSLLSENIASNPKQNSLISHQSSYDLWRSQCYPTEPRDPPSVQFASSMPLCTSVSELMDPRGGKLAAASLEPDGLGSIPITEVISPLWLLLFLA